MRLGLTSRKSRGYGMSRRRESRGVDGQKVVVSSAQEVTDTSQSRNAKTTVWRDLAEVAARRVSGVPATSASSAPSFSLARGTLEDRRTQLVGDSVD